MNRKSFLASLFVAPFAAKAIASAIEKEKPAPIYIPDSGCGAATVYIPDQNVTIAVAINGIEYEVNTVAAVSKDGRRGKRHRVSK